MQLLAAAAGFALWALGTADSARASQPARRKEQRSLPWTTGAPALPSREPEAFLACPDFRQPCWQWPAAYVYVLHRRSDVRAVHVCRYLNATLVDRCPGNIREHHCQQCHHQPPTGFFPAPACKLHRPPCPCARRAQRAANSHLARLLTLLCKSSQLSTDAVTTTETGAKEPVRCVIFSTIASGAAAAPNSRTMDQEAQKKLASLALVGLAVLGSVLVAWSGRTQQLLIVSGSTLGSLSRNRGSLGSVGSIGAREAACKFCCFSLDFPRPGSRRCCPHLYAILCLYITNFEVLCARRLRWLILQHRCGASQAACKQCTSTGLCLFTASEGDLLDGVSMTERWCMYDRDRA